MSNTPKKTIIVSTGVTPQSKKSFAAGVLLNFSNGKKGGLAVELLMIMDKKEGRSFQRIPLAGSNYRNYLGDLPAAVGAVLKKLTDEALIGILVKNGFAWLGDAEKPFEHLDERHLKLLNEWMGSVLQELKPLAPAILHLFYLPAGQVFTNHTIRPAAVSASTPALQFKLERADRELYLRCTIIIGNGVYPLDEFQQVPYFLKSGNEFFLLTKADRDTLDRLQAGAFHTREEGLPRWMDTVVKPLAEKYPVDMEAVIRREVVDVQPQGRVYVSELNENFLLIKPKWLYADLEMEADEEVETKVEKEDVVFAVIRRKSEENDLSDAIRALHPKFQGQSNGYFYLNFKEALEKSWFLNFYNKMLQMDIPVLGMNKLRKFKYNTNTPRFEILAGKSIDWFDLTIRVSYGELTVPLNELRKAILGRQDFILLSDGSLGMLPKEWIERYGLLMRMGQVREGGLKLSRVHWSLLEEAGGSSIDEVLQKELAAKKQRLLDVIGIAKSGVTGSGVADGEPEAGDVAEAGVAAGHGQQWKLSPGIQAKLRDYQVGGFQWMCLLDEMGWGGCLADDMGLGKTLQTISFLHHLVDHYPDETHLVVCPTSLLYNWEGELKKFAPGLDWHIHYGADRVLDDETFSRAHVIITSYGMVRNDIQHFASRTFGYIVLDESQSIKNPASQVRKAVQQLQSRNRLALSGTPVQNNTFDLYAQMDFLNPGMLGSMDLFRMEFATPIDKNGDKEAALRLRKLVYPFILRRTKEQVAKDLPDRTEMILWCEMGDEQRKIYNTFKEYYRESILDRIAEEGVGKTSIYILEGLTKLRQICDSPALVKESGMGGPVIGAEGKNASAKLEELIREIEENTGHHKALVFSQFTSMLALIREALAVREIPFLYLDGSVSAEARKKAVQQFQEEEDTRVFLISLKAGGVGLTLTAADYVYLVDPWWNPAAEQQAIDRSHRIGQEKKVFAYRMICKDTVEEKILQLQEKKRGLAADLVADESGFVKKLTQEDVAYLFS